MYVWSVYDGEEMLQCLEMGAGGIISGYPRELLRVRDGCEAERPNAEYQRP